MTISEQALSKSQARVHSGVPVKEMPETEHSITEQFRLAAKAWVEADRLASLAEELKSSKLSEMILRDSALPVNRAEAQAKASTEWREYIQDMVAKRSEANLAKVRMEWLRMREREIERADWAQRSERKMGRTGT